MLTFFVVCSLLFLQYHDDVHTPKIQWYGDLVWWIADGPHPVWRAIYPVHVEDRYCDEMRVDAITGELVAEDNDCASTVNRKLSTSHSLVPFGFPCVQYAFT